MIGRFCELFYDMGLVKQEKAEKAFIGLSNSFKAYQPLKIADPSLVMIWGICGYVLSLALLLTNDTQLSFEHALTAYSWVEKIEIQPSTDCFEAIVLLKCELNLLISEICRVELVLVEKRM